MTLEQTLQKCSQGFSSLNVSEHFKETALTHLKTWLTQDLYQDYVPQIEFMISQESWDYLLDSFYQIIHFGTGGRRGEVGIGPNRINPFTIEASAQGHSQYLLKEFGQKAKTRGVVLAYDVREFFTNKYFDDSLPNPVTNLTCKHLAEGAARVYTANSITVHIFDNVRTTPELSFAIRHLNALGGAMFSASHNPPEHNGKKVFDQFGGQLIPPYDEALVNEVTQNVKVIHKISTENALQKNLLKTIDASLDDEYSKAVTKLSLSHERNVIIAYTPLHGSGSTSVVKSLNEAGFIVHKDPLTSNPSGKFEHVTFNIPNPEVIQSFDTTIPFASKISADIILSSDPDADRIGVMVFHNNEWVFMNGNEIGIILTEYAIQKWKQQGQMSGVVIKTSVTSGLISYIAKTNGFTAIDNLLVGFKFIGEEMNKLEQNNDIESFTFGAEESHGYIAGNYIREKDAAIAALWLSELAAELKTQNKTLIDEMNRIYQTYGFYKNYLTEIRLPGAEGMGKIQTIQEMLRNSAPQAFGSYKVLSVEDWLDRTPIISETDKAGKQGLVFQLTSINSSITSIKVTVRPSGTEPKIKMYFEIGTQNSSDLPLTKNKAESTLRDVEQVFMNHCYNIIGVDFPKRGYLLFWQLPLQSKLQYFEIEENIHNLRNEPQEETRIAKLTSLISFLGSDPIEKIDGAYKEKYNCSIREDLDLPNY